jgi:hypothetical protein
VPRRRGQPGFSARTTSAGHRGIYQCTGAPATLKTALRTLERSAATQPIAIRCASGFPGSPVIKPRQVALAQMEEMPWAPKNARWQSEASQADPSVEKLPVDLKGGTVGRAETGEPAFPVRDRSHHVVRHPREHGDHCLVACGQHGERFRPAGSVAALVVWGSVASASRWPIGKRPSPDLAEGNPRKAKGLTHTIFWVGTGAPA